MSVVNNETLPVVSNELSIVAGVTEFDTIDADCIAVGRVTRVTPDNSIAQLIHAVPQYQHPGCGTKKQSFTCFVIRPLSDTVPF